MSSKSNDAGGSGDTNDDRYPGAFPSTTAEPPASSLQPLARLVYDKRAEYIRPRRLRIKIGTWNAGAARDLESELVSWFVNNEGIIESLAGWTRQATDGGEVKPCSTASSQNLGQTRSESGDDKFDMYILGLQEIVDINSPAESLKPFTDPAGANKLKDALLEALPKGYSLVADKQLLGLLLFVFASPSIAPEISSVSSTSVGTGLMGYMGNKGAVATRIVLGEATRLAFVNSHLAAGADKATLTRRNWDASQIIGRTRFEPVPIFEGASTGSPESIGDEDIIFWFGDLNYRIEGMSGEDVRRLLMLHTGHLDAGRQQKTEPDSTGPQAGSSESKDSDGASQITLTGSENSSVASAQTKVESEASSNNSHREEIKGDSSDDTADDALHPRDDPAHLITTLTSLIPHDELSQQRRERKAFHDGWREAPLEHLPTYKYDEGSVGIFDSSEKKRCPSWCDRILYRTRRDLLAHDNLIKEENDTKSKDEQLKSSGIEQAANDESVLFDYDPDKDGDEDSDADAATIKMADMHLDEDKTVVQECYLAHQLVTASDHKPLSANFQLVCEMVDPQLKSQVHAEVVRELDRAENEGRPSITLLMNEGDSDGRRRTNTEDFQEVLDFGSVRFEEPQRTSITVANTGRVSASLGIIAQIDFDGDVKEALPRWLKIQFEDSPADSPKNGSNLSLDLEPGDARNIDFELLVDDITLVRALNDGNATLEEVIILRVTDGRDHFVPVKAHWLPSCFGWSFAQLIRMPEGGVRHRDCRERFSRNSISSNTGADTARQQSSDVAGETDGDRDLSSPTLVRWSAPRELFRLTGCLELLVEHSIAEWDMTSEASSVAPWESSAGWPFDSNHWTATSAWDRKTLCVEVREALDCDRDFSDDFTAANSSRVRLEVIVSTLIDFLRSIEDGVVTEDDWSRLEAGIIQQEKSQQQAPHITAEDEREWILEVLAGSPSHNVAFILLTSMLSRVLKSIASAVKVGPDATPIAPTPDIPPSPARRVNSFGIMGGVVGSSAKLRSLSQLSEVERKEARQTALAQVFAELLIRSPGPVAGVKIKERERRVVEERKMRVINAFLREDSV